MIPFLELMIDINVNYFCSVHVSRILHLRINHRVSMDILGAIEVYNGRILLTALVRGLLLYTGEILFDGISTGEVWYTS
jgi:hypothetical protein